MTTLAYWHALKLRYHMPDSASYHRAAWALLGARAAPLLRMAPILQTPVGFAQRWFENMPR
jgi:hypothetical protein